MKTKRLIRAVTQAGAVFLRHRGSHRLYQFPNGDRIMIPQSGAHLEADRTYVKLARRAILRNGGTGVMR